MSHQRCLEGYAAVVHSRAEACPLQGWYKRRQSATLRHPTRKQGAGCTSPPRCAGGWVPRTATIGGSGRKGRWCLYPTRVSGVVRCRYIGGVG